MTAFGLSSVFLLMNATFCCSVKLGILMCKQKCLHIKDCKGFQFKTEHLQCHLVSDIPRTTLHGGVTRLSKRETIKGTCSPKSCSTGGLCLRNKARHDVCVWIQRKVKGSINTAEKQQKDEARLFILYNKSICLKSYQEMNMETKNIKPYLYLTLDHIASACYMPVSRKILISTTKPKRLLSHQVDSQKNIVLGKGVVYFKLAVDEERQLIFGLPKIYSTEVTKRSIENGQVTTFNLEGKGRPPNDIAVDSINMRLFLPFGKSIEILGYDGTRREQFTDGLNFCAVVFDLKEQTLYYNSDTMLFRRKMSLGRSYKVAEIPFYTSPNRFQLFTGTLYVSTSSANIAVIDVFDEGNIQTITTHFDHPIICLYV